MASLIFPFPSAVSGLITPSKRGVQEERKSRKIGRGQKAEYRPNTPLTVEEQTETVPWLFSKASLTRVTYSRHFRRTFGNNNEMLEEEFIPKLPDNGMRSALQRLRSQVLPKVEPLPPALYELGNDPATWGDMAPYIWYNVLLGPFDYNQKYSGKRYDSLEDQFEIFNDNDNYTAEMNILPPQDTLGDSEMLYWQNVIMCGHNTGSQNATYFIVTYEEPSEEQIVDYLRKKRKEFDQNSETFMFFLFHNLLVPYVFGKK
jgi:hypothetical protein